MQSIPLWSQHLKWPAHRCPAPPHAGAHQQRAAGEPGQAPGRRRLRLRRQRHAHGKQMPRSCLPTMCITLLLCGAVTCGACQQRPAHGHGQVPVCPCVRAMRVCATHCSTHPASQGDPCAAPMGSCLRRRSRSHRHLCANRANLPAERRVRRLWRWPHSSGGGKAQRRIYRQVNGMLIRHSPCTL